MSEAIKYLNKMIENRLTDLHTAMPCKVESYNEAEGTAKVIPLFKIKFLGEDVAQERPPLIDVPVIKHRYRISGNLVEYKPVYQAGDIVLVIFLERAFDMVKNGEIADPIYNRKHALDDSIIIGLL
jgi:hypothetical protein